MEEGADDVVVVVDAAAAAATDDDGGGGGIRQRANADSHSGDGSLQTAPVE